MLLYHLQHKNQEKQFLKIPKNWQGITWEKRNVYVAYLWVKRYSRFGRIHISHLPKKHFHHHITKLISAGFMRRDGEHYVLLGYEQVWKLLGIKKVNCNKTKKHSFFKLLDYSTWSVFKQKTIESIQGYQTERKKAQLKRRLKSQVGMSKDVIYRPLFSGAAAAKLFGYKSWITGGKYRQKFFDVVEEPLRLRLHKTSDELPYWKYDCKRIELRTIYHEVKKVKDIEVGN